MKLQTGIIYSLSYRDYKQDPYPMILVLYCDKEICHAINLHYLQGKLNQQISDMIMKIATKALRMESMYDHYHRWMKKEIPGVIKKAYRTYKPNKMSHVRQLTIGYWGIQTFIQELNKKNKPITATEVQKKLQQQLSKRSKKKIKIKQEAYTYNIKQMEETIKNYVNSMDDVVKKYGKEDLSKFTRLHKKNS